MYRRGTRDEQQTYNRCPTPNREYIIPNFQVPEISHSIGCPCCYLAIELRINISSLSNIKLEFQLDSSHSLVLSKNIGVCQLAMAQNYPMNLFLNS